MRRVIYFLVAGALVIAFAWFLAGLPGQITAQFGSTTVQASTPVAATALLLLLLTLAVLYRVLAALFGLPRRTGVWRSRRRRTAGDTAVTRTLLALAAGEMDAARAHALGALDELYQAELWGEDTEAAARRRGIAEDLALAERYLVLTRERAA